MPLLSTMLAVAGEVLLHIPKSVGAKLAETVVLPAWYQAVANRNAPRLWKQVFVEAGRCTPDFPEVDLEKLSLTPGFLRLLINSFRPDRQHEFPDCRLFALTTAFELMDNHRTADPLVIRKFASNLHRIWCTTLNGRAGLKYYLNDQRALHPSKLMQDSSCSPNLDPILSDPVQLATAYFGTYTQPNGADEVTIWLSGADRVVDYTRRVAVAVLDAHGAEYGFFRGNYDYSLNRGGADLWLRAVHRDTTRFTETAWFQRYELGDTSGELLWAM